MSSGIRIKRGAPVGVEKLRVLIFKKLLTLIIAYGHRSFLNRSPRRRPSLLPASETPVGEIAIRVCEAALSDIPGIVRVNIATAG
jgi:hypothetical protein